jgi:uncharacterized membrane protein YjgN (DUF898 family)
MNETVPPSPPAVPSVPPPLPSASSVPSVPTAPPAVPVVFSGQRADFRGLVFRGALLELVTLGFYRFWLATNIRRHLWSHTSAGGDALEYTGSAKELLVGFLVALAIMAPIYLLYFLIGIEAERAQAFASIPLGVFLYLFAQFALYRARRYRLTRTIWRGVRFGMGGSGLSYMWRAGLWTLLAILTVGLLLPWRQAALERYKAGHTSYGNLRGGFTGTGWQLFRRVWGYWLATVVLLLLSTLLALLPALGFLAVLLFFVGGIFVYAMYKAAEWQWWIAGLRLGEVRFETSMSSGEFVDLYWKVAGWAVLIFAIFWLVVAGAVAGVFWSANWDPAAAAASQPIWLFVPVAVTYLLFVLAFWALMRIYLIHDVWQRVSSAMTIHNFDAAEAVALEGPTVSALGEGFADSLDVGGF